MSKMCVFGPTHQIKRISELSPFSEWGPHFIVTVPTVFLFLYVIFTNDLFVKPVLSISLLITCEYSMITYFNNRVAPSLVKCLCSQKLQTNASLCVASDNFFMPPSVMSCGYAACVSTLL